MATTNNPNAADAPLAPPVDPMAQVTSWLKNLYLQAQNANTGGGNPQAASPDNNLANQLGYWGANGGTVAPNNVAQGSSPEISADSAQSLQQPLHPIQQAALDGAVKATKEQAYQAVQQGGPAAATHIVDKFGGGNPQVNPQGQDAISSVLSAAPNSTQQPQPDIQTQINNNVMQRILQASQAPQGILDKFGQNVRDLSGISAARNANIGQIQQMSGNQQDAVSQYQKSLTSEVQQKIAGKEPLQASDYATIVGSMNSLSLDALKTASQKMDDDLKDRQAEIDTSQKTINMMGRLGGLFNTSGQTVTKASAAAQKEMGKLKLAKAAVDSQIATFKPRNPITNKVDMQAPSGAAHYSPSTGKYYDAQGQEMK